MKTMRFTPLRALTMTPTEFATWKAAFDNKAAVSASLYKLYKDAAISGRVDLESAYRQSITRLQAEIYRDFGIP